MGSYCLLKIRLELSIMKPKMRAANNKYRKISFLSANAVTQSTIYRKLKNRKTEEIFEGTGMKSQRFF